MLIRRASEADAASFAAITDAAFSKWISAIGRKPQPMTADFHQMLRDHAGWLLDDGPRPVAAMLLMHLPDHVLIYSIAVLPEAQGQGHGHRLMEFAESEADRRAVPEVRLYTNARFTDNVAWYSRLGYRVTHTEAVLGSVVVHMAKPVAVGRLPT